MPRVRWPRALKSAAVRGSPNPAVRGEIDAAVRGSFKPAVCGRSTPPSTAHLSLPPFTGDRRRRLRLSQARLECMWQARRPPLTQARRPPLSPSQVPVDPVHTSRPGVPCLCLVVMSCLVHGDSSGAGGSSDCGRGGHSLPPCR